MTLTACEVQLLAPHGTHDDDHCEYHVPLAYRCGADRDLKRLAGAGLTATCQFQMSFHKPTRSATMQRVIDQCCRCGTMWTLVFSLETEGLRDFTDCRDLKALICVRMTTRAIQHIPAHLSFGAVTCNRDN